MLRRISTVAAICVLSVIAYAVYHSASHANPRTFDECVVSEMRGQSIFMEPNVRKLCGQRFGLIYDITKSGIQIDWGVTGEAKHSSTIPNPLFPITLKVRPNNADWLVTKAVVSYAYRRCDAQPPLLAIEFTSALTVSFKDDVATITLPGAFDHNQSKYVPPACQRIIQLWGRYR
jgi:hypothetical protein